MALPSVTMSGNLTADPELRFTPSGAAVANFTVACTDRRLNRDTNEWEDGATIFLRCAVWRQKAENFAESARRGTSVIVNGTITQREYEKDGEKRYVIEMANVFSVGIEITGNQVAKAEKLRSGAPAGATSAPGAADDPWAAAPGGAAAGGYASDEPPFAHRMPRFDTGADIAV